MSRCVPTSNSGPLTSSTIQHSSKDHQITNIVCKAEETGLRENSRRADLSEFGDDNSIQSKFCTPPAFFGLKVFVKIPLTPKVCGNLVRNVFLVVR